MITPEFVRTMAAYNAEMNRRWYDAAARMTDAERKADQGAFWRSIHGTLNHLLWADRMWLARFGVGERPGVNLKQSDSLHADFAVLRDERAALDATIESWAQGVDAGWLAGDLAWISGATQREMRKPRALVVVHFFNHQAHHRGQVHALLTGAGQATGDTDLPFVL